MFGKYSVSNVYGPSTRCSVLNENASRLWDMNRMKRADGGEETGSQAAEGATEQRRQQSITDQRGESIATSPKKPCGLFSGKNASIQRFPHI